ncbi:hypothetical protein O181_087820 [Austropuccinia psidii MF-1]|uniref:Uncharacterized protein n=1 Tax=Austropuccinia psidii MF-1 TaxID=1389203 RepID=A0A9Q3P2N3_9BASI|nr:hypothetical protein [Austropuccinia psidii MF-1]
MYTLKLMEENEIPLETQSQANTPVIPSDPGDGKEKGKRHSESLITAKKWTPIAIKRSRKPQNAASIQGKPTLTACTGKITIINPVVTSKGKFLKSADNKFVQGAVKETSNQRISSSALPTPQRFISMEHGQQEVQPSISLGRTWSKFPEDLSQRYRLQRPYDNDQRLESHQAVQTPGGEVKQDKGESSHYPSYGRTTDPDRAHSDSFRLTRSRPNQLSNGFTPFRNQQVSGQESPFFTLPGGLQEKTRTQGQEQDLF